MSAKAAKRACPPAAPAASFPGPARQKRQRRVPERFTNAKQNELTAAERRALKQALENSTMLTKREFVNVKLAPTFYPTAQEFADPVKFISSIRAQGEKAGIARIVPPKGWNPPSAMSVAFQGAQNRKFPTKKQYVHKLQEGASYGDGKRYQIDEFKAMADAFRAQMIAKMQREGRCSGVDDDANESTATASAAPEKGISDGAPDRAAKPLKAKPATVSSASSSSAASAAAASMDSRPAGSETPPSAAMDADGPSSPSASSSSSSAAAPSSAPQVTLLDLEKEYWRIVETGCEKLSVEYGSDLDTIRFGSGFPVSAAATARSQSDADPAVVAAAVAAAAAQSGNGAGGVPCAFDDPNYYKHTGWNLNNLPHAPGSVLRHIKGNYNGINVPWLYVGQLFGTFAWHNEDNYLYSISYNHMGAPKVWYGVPGTQAHKLEECLRAFLMERFRDMPDLIYHLVTMIGPSILRNKGVDVSKAIQEPGTFIVTFPQAFHGGFSTGFNIGEAVNFACPDWLPHGHACAERYRRWARSSPISRERLVMAMARNLDELDLPACRFLAADLQRLRDEQEALRRSVYEAGVLHAMQMPHEKPDDEEFDEKRLCSVCQHLCFFSAVVCSCDGDKVVCLRHHQELCNCNRRDNCFLFWYTVKEMDQALEGVKAHIAGLANTGRLTASGAAARGSSGSSSSGGGSAAVVDLTR